MIGIYKITNKKNNKVYIGQSNNIERRFREHKSGHSIKYPIGKAIEKYGIDNFNFEILEECSLDELDERETFWIKKYNSYFIGYNCNLGGEFSTIGENNGRALLTKEDVIKIRKAYAERKRRKDIYEDFKEKISFHTFSAIWDGRTWSHIMPEVFTKENLLYYSKGSTLGEKSFTAILSDKEVVEIRKRYVNETAKEIWEDYKNKIAYQTIQQLLWGRTYKYLPIYKKKEKKWINL